MPYKYIDVEVSSKDFTDLKRTIDIFAKFIEALSGKIKSCNFNRYGKTRLSIRINSDESGIEKMVLSKAQELQRVGEIINFTREVKDWREPEFVVNAHELGTACAQELRRLFECNSNVYQAFQGRRDHFMGHFVLSMLNHAGFNITPIWSILRETPLREEITEKFEEMTNQCARIIKERLTEPPGASFLERFVHSFINCTAPDTEGVVMTWLLHASLWELIGDTWKTKELTEYAGTNREKLNQNLQLRRERIESSQKRNEYTTNVIDKRRSLYVPDAEPNPLTLCETIALLISRFRRKLMLCVRDRSR